MTCSAGRQQAWTHRTVPATLLRGPGRATSRVTPGPVFAGGRGDRPPDGPGPVSAPGPNGNHDEAVVRGDGGPFDSLDSPSMSDPRPATPEEAADVRRMHAATRAAWDEAAERYERWFDEAVDLIRAAGSILFPVEHDLIGDLHGRCRRAIHLQCAGGRDTLSLWNLGADEVVGVDFSPRMLALAGRLAASTGAPARWVEADIVAAPHELDGTGDLVYTGRGSRPWIADLAAWAAVVVRLLAPDGRFVLFEGHRA